MARDNHPRERRAKALARKKGTRPPYDRVLIVCEGTKTEPQYFQEILRQFRIPSAHIKVIPADGTSPLQVVNSALAEFQKTREYDRIFAVFDRDDHLTYANALARAAALDGSQRNDEKKAVRFAAAPSVPCFELWLLLHFQNVFAFAHRDELIDQLAGHLGGYSKGAKGTYAQTEPMLAAATARAVHLRTQFVAETGTDPFTRIDEVVALLRSIKPSV